MGGWGIDGTFIDRDQLVCRRSRRYEKGGKKIIENTLKDKNH